jgi:hypothetical protein
MPAVSDALANILRHLMNVYEKLRMRKRWQRANFQLHTYWYLRGVLSQFGSRKKFVKYFKSVKSSNADAVRMNIDLADGLEKVLSRVDQERPDSVQITFNGIKVGTIGPWKGGERLRGNQVRAFLATNLSWTLVEAMSIDGLSRKNKQSQMVHV